MAEIFIRKASRADAPAVTNFIRLMLEEMESMGGHRIARYDEEWKRFRETIEEMIDSEDCFYLLAYDAKSMANSIGVVEAQIVRMGDIFRLKKRLHIRAVYVLKDYRRKGVARELLKAVLDQGKKSGCVEADLDVLSGNPARHLYETLDFQEFEVKMVRKL